MLPGKELSELRGLSKMGRMVLLWSTAPENESEGWPGEIKTSGRGGLSGCVLRYAKDVVKTGGKELLKGSSE
jgi:hypothetical protein